MRTTRHLLAAMTLAAVTLLSGCATVTQGTNQHVTLHTDPDGATCDVTRETGVVASLSATPGQVMVDRGWGAIDIACRKAEHQTILLRVDSEVQAWTFGNILLGGLIGFAVDAASGAMRQYPQFITLTLVPEAFASTDARDRYVQTRRQRFEEEGARARELLEKRCVPENCEAERGKLKAVEEKRLVEFHARVDRARIAPPPPAPAPAAPPADAPAQPAPAGG